METTQTVTLVNWWTSALLEEITLAQAYAEIVLNTHPTNVNNARNEIRKAFRADDGRAVFGMLRT